MWVGVLGTTVVRASPPDRGADPATGDTIALKAAKHRALVAALALEPGRFVSADALVEGIWGAGAPPSAQSTLQGYVSVVRRALEPDLPARTPSRYLVSSDAGYELRVDDGLDVALFTRTIREVHALLGPLTATTTPVSEDVAAAGAALERLDAALALWRGEPYEDLVASDAVTAERARLGELRLLALEDRATLLVASGSPAPAVSELEALTARHPLRERLWTLLAVAQARTGRQADALATLERLRTVLTEELGIDPSPAVRDLQTAILRQEDTVSATPTIHAPSAERTQAPAPAPAPAMVDVPEWPLVGREEQLEALRSLLAVAESGTPAFAVLVGDPGAGKSRLATELALRAQDAGALVLVGRCSQDEDAPPLWPWTTALGRAAEATPAAPPGAPATDHDAARFQLWEDIRADLLRLASERTVVLVLEDLHWADASSLRVLRHLCATPATGRLLVVCTWRSGSSGTALGEAVEALARRHATQLELDGLTDAGAREVLSAVAGESVSDGTAAAVRERTDGNPFFLVEYARLAHDERRDLTDVLAAAGLPRNVSEVVQRRLRQLPDKTLAVLTAAAVVGREFDLSLVASALDLPDQEVLDLIEPALEARLVEDLGADSFRFAHALVRESAYAEIGPSRRQRMHASLAGRLAASAAAERRAPEIARHWAGAGPRHAREAWQAAAHAGELAMRAHAADEAADQFTSAVSLHAQDPVGTAAERYDLLVGLAEAARWSTRLTEMTRAADEAIRVAAGLGEPALVVRASATASAGSIWPVRAYGTVNHEVVALMREALDGLPSGDSELRCRLLLCLAGELYYGPNPREIEALVDEGIAMARRLGDTSLLIDVCQAGAVARWGRGTPGGRRALVEESLDLARTADEGQAAIIGRFLLAAERLAAGEAGGLRAELGAVVRDAREQRMYFVEMAALCLQHSWSVLRGDHDEMALLAARLVELDDLVSLAHKSDAIRGALLLPLLWDPDLEVDPALFSGYVEEALVPIGPSFAVLRLRRGFLEAAREVWGQFDYEVGLDNWYAPIHRAFGAEIALHLGEADLAAQLYERLLPLRDGCVISGTGPACGPADAYLALAAAAAGEPDVARGHADTAAALCRAWELPQVARWLGDLRDRFGF